MKDQKQTEVAAFSQEVSAECHHVCLIYDDEQQRRKIVADYLSTGLKRGEKVRYFRDTTTVHEIRTWLMETGVDLVKAEEKGAFGIHEAERAYCPSGQFTPEKMLANMAASYARARNAGYCGTRNTGEMSWALRCIPGTERFLEYEVRINMITETFPHSGMCQYDARLFDGATLFKVLQVHPFMIAYGQLVRNPFYIEPEEFLSQLGQHQ
jgi:hypothetical protein